jgi:hypothetical protein
VLGPGVLTDPTVHLVHLVPSPFIRKREKKRKEKKKKRKEKKVEDAGTAAK